MHFGFNNQFIKVKRILAKISKTTKILFCLSLSIQGMPLHVMHIPDIYFFFSDNRTWGMELHAMRIPNNKKPQHDLRFYQTLKQCNLP